MVLVDNINKYCEAYSLPVARFEKDCGLGNGIVNQWRSGINKNPSITTLQKIAGKTGIEMSDWLKEGGVEQYFKKHPVKSKGARKKAE